MNGASIFSYSKQLRGVGRVFYFFMEKSKQLEVDCVLQKLFLKINVYAEKL